MRNVPVVLGQLQLLTNGQRSAVLPYSEELAWAIHDSGLGLVVVFSHGEKKIIARGRTSYLVGFCRRWRQPFTSEIDFKPESAATIAGWFGKPRRSEFSTEF